jgi:hypothetical protein
MNKTARTWVLRTGALAATATLCLPASIQPANAVESKQCTVSASVVVNGSIGGNHTVVNCAAAENVKVYMSATTVVNGIRYTVHPSIDPKSYARLTGKMTYDLPTYIDGVATLEVSSKVCYKWSSTTKCRVSSDSIDLNW